MNQSDLLRQAASCSVVLSCCHIETPTYALLMENEGPGGDSFGARLARIRKQRGLTQAELGRGLATNGEDAGKQVVYGWEKDQHYPRVDQLMLICAKLGISADFLLFGDEAAASNVRVAAAEAVLQQLGPDERLRLVEKVRHDDADADQRIRQIARSGKDMQTPDQNHSRSPETSYSQPFNNADTPTQRAERQARRMMGLDEDAGQQSSTNRERTRPKAR